MGYVDDACFGEIGGAFFERDVAGGAGAREVGGDQADDGGGEAAAVEDVTLDYDAGAEVEPIDFALVDFGHQRSLMVERNLAFMFWVVEASVGSGWSE